MDAGPRQRRRPASNADQRRESTTATAFTQFLRLQLLISAEHSSRNQVSQLDSSHLDIVSNSTLKMSNSGGSSSGSSQNWDDLLKHGSALSIIKPDVAFPPYGGSSSSSGTSDSTSGGSSGGGSGSTTTYPTSGRY